MVTRPEDADDCGRETIGTIGLFVSNGNFSKSKQMKPVGQHGKIEFQGYWSYCLGRNLPAGDIPPPPFSLGAGWDGDGTHVLVTGRLMNTRMQYTITCVLYNMILYLMLENSDTCS